MTGLLIMTMLAVLVGVLATWVGVDSRDGQDWMGRMEPWRAPGDPERRRAVGRDRPAARSLTARLVTARLVTALSRRWRAQVRAWDTLLRDLRPWRKEGLRWCEDRDGPRLTGRLVPSWPSADTVKDDSVPRRPDPSG